MPAPQGSFARWLRDDAFDLQLKEADGKEAEFAACRDPELARKWFVGLCLYRFSADIREMIRDAVNDTRTFPPGGPSIRMFFFGLMATIQESPEEYPFSLSEREFVFYSKQNFGDEIQNLEGIYHPPNFYAALAQDIGTVLAGAGVGFLATGAVPAAAAGASVAGRLAPEIARAAVSGTTGAVLNHLMPGGSWDAAKKDRLWPRYQLDYQRRQLT